MVTCVIASYPRSGSNWFADLLGYSIKNNYHPSKRNILFPLDPQKPKEYVRTHGLSEATRRIFIVRHPLDVGLSFIDFANLTGFGKQCPDILNFFLETGKHPNLSDTWNDLCYAYNTDHTFWLSYEQLHRNPVSVMYNVIDFLGFKKPKTENIIINALKKSCFEKMRLDEENGIIYDNAIRHKDCGNSKFYNHGKPGRRFEYSIEIQESFELSFKKGIDIAKKRIDAPFNFSY